MKKTKVKITDIRLAYNEKYATLKDQNGNKIITAPLEYIKEAIKTRNYKLIKR